MKTIKTLSKVMIGITIGIELAFMAMVDAYCDSKDKIFVDIE